MINLKDFPRPIQKYWLKYRMRKNDGVLYRLVSTDGIQCMVCGNVSFNMKDVQHKFCIECGNLEDAARDLYVPKKNHYSG